jgi:hypothetical protein
VKLSAPRAVASTMAQAGLSDPAFDRPYRWRKTPGWQPGAPHLRETEPRRPGPAPDHPSSREAKAARFAVFTAARDGGDGVTEAGRAAGVQPKTARTYEKERKAALLEQQRGESRNG